MVLPPPAARGRGAVRAFASAARAERFRLRCERRTRARLPKANPFRLCGDWDADYAAVTSLPEFALFDWLADAGISPPAGPRAPLHNAGRLSSYDWYLWWRTTARRMTPEQLAHAWAGLDRVTFFEVVAVEWGEP